MQYVLITLSGGIIDRVRFYDNQERAIRELSEFVRTMDPENNDGAVYSPEGMVSNAKDFLDEELG